MYKETLISNDLNDIAVMFVDVSLLNVNWRWVILVLFKIDRFSLFYVWFSLILWAEGVLIFAPTYTILEKHAPF